MRILITGNMGYVGPVVVERLRASHPDAELIGVDTGFFAHCLTTPDLLPETLLTTQHFADVRELDSKLLDGVNSIVQLAAISNDPMGKAYEAVTADVNCNAAVDIARRAKDSGARSFVFASSCSVYGFAEGGPRDEKSETGPLTAYAKSKLAAEEALAELAGPEFTVTCLRFPTACGMSPRLRLDLVLNDFVASAVASGEITILSDGTPWRPLIDVRDMARAIDWAVNRRANKGGDFLSINVGRNEWNYQVRDLAHAIQKLMPKVEVSINTDAAPDKRSYQVNFDRYHELAPDHLPQFGLEQSIVALKEGLERMGFSDKGFRESQHMRLRVLGEHRQSGRLDEELRWVRTRS